MSGTFDQILQILSVLGGTSMILLGKELAVPQLSSPTWQEILKEFFQNGRGGGAKRSFGSWHDIVTRHSVSSGKLTQLWKSPFIVDFPMKNGDFP